MQNMGGIYPSICLSIHWTEEHLCPQVLSVLQWSTAPQAFVPLWGRSPKREIEGEEQDDDGKKEKEKEKMKDIKN